MKVLNESELALISGGAADFSDVTATVDSTEELVSPVSNGALKVWVCITTGICLK